MSLIDALILMLTIIGIVGIGWLIIALFVLLYGWIETKILRKRVPIKIQKEVEDARIKREGIREDFRRKYAGTGNAETERTFESARTGIDTQQPEGMEEVGHEGIIPDGRIPDLIDVGSSETEGRIKSARRNSKWRTI